MQKLPQWRSCAPHLHDQTIVVADEGLISGSCTFRWCVPPTAHNAGRQNRPRPGGGTYGYELEKSVLHAPGRVGGEFQATGFGISLYQSVQARLVNGNFTPV
jgi:hypothetical protein